MEEIFQQRLTYIRSCFSSRIQQTGSQAGATIQILDMSDAGKQPEAHAASEEGSKGKSEAALFGSQALQATVAAVVLRFLDSGSTADYVWQACL